MQTADNALANLAIDRAFVTARAKMHRAETILIGEPTCPMSIAMHDALYDEARAVLAAAVGERDAAYCMKYGTSITIEALYNERAVATAGF